MLYRIVVTPTKETIDYIYNLTRYSPIQKQFELDNLEVTLAYSETPFTDVSIPEDAVLTFNVASSGIYYDQHLQASNWYLELTSPNYSEYAAMLQAQKADILLPATMFTVLMYQVPPMKRNVRGFINSFSNVMADNNPNLYFSYAVQLYDEEYLKNEQYLLAIQNR